MTKLRALLLVLGLAAFLLASASLPHLHTSGELGLWNQEHDLSLMAARGSAAAQPDAAPALILALALVAALAPVSSRLFGGPLRLADSRAPPAR